MDDEDEELEPEVDPNSIKVRFDKFDSESHKFERIPEAERLHPNQRLCVFMKVASLMSDPEKFEVFAEHDIIGMPNDDEFKSPITDDDILYLVRCGVRWSTEFDCLAMFC